MPLDGQRTAVILWPAPWSSPRICNDCGQAAYNYVEQYFQRAICGERTSNDLPSFRVYVIDFSFWGFGPSPLVAGQFIFPYVEAKGSISRWHCKGFRD
jgi:hypothetical protein